MNQSKLILVVEDDEFIRDAVNDLLQSEDYRVMSAENGQVALDFLREAEELPALILLDLMMPVKDGFQFREEQRLDPRLNQIPVVIMSADGNILEKKEQTQASAYLKKPVGIEEILEAIRIYAS